jgi:carbon storage regulator
MLVLSRKVSQQVMIGSDVSITIVRIDRNQVRIGITAPPGVSILRQELVDRRREVGPQLAEEANRIQAELV